jgi:hypothetical protein
MRGADPVNDELEVGYDEPFELRWFALERAGHLLMLVFVGAALAGLMGHGPFSHRSLAASDGSLRVDYEPVARFGTPTQITLHLSSPPDPAGARPEAAVHIGTPAVEPLGLQQVIPQPLRTIVEADGMTMIFPVPPGQTDLLVRLQARPTATGPIAVTAHEGSGRPLRWTQYILP